MNIEKINEAMARVEFGNQFDHIDPADPSKVWVCEDRQSGEIGWHDNRNYPKDHNAVQRVIDGLSEDELIKYNSILRAILCRDLEGRDGSYVRDYKLHLATALQKCEAILKAKGLWSNGN